MSNKTDSKQPGPGDGSCQLSRTTLTRREKDVDPAAPRPALLLAGAAEPLHGGSEKQWAVPWNPFPQPRRPHGADVPSVPSTSLYGGDTRSDAMNASCPAFPRRSGSPTRLPDREPGAPDSPQWALPSPTPTPTQRLLPRAYCYCKKIDWAPKRGQRLTQEENTPLPNSRAQRDRR